MGVSKGGLFVQKKGVQGASSTQSFCMKKTNDYFWICMLVSR